MIDEEINQYLIESAKEKRRNKIKKFLWLWAYALTAIFIMVVGFGTFLGTVSLFISGFWFIAIPYAILGVGATVGSACLAGWCCDKSIDCK